MECNDYLSAGKCWISDGQDEKPMWRTCEAQNLKNRATWTDWQNIDRSDTVKPSTDYKETSRFECIPTMTRWYWDTRNL